MAREEDTTIPAHLTSTAQTEIDEPRLSEFHSSIKDFNPLPPHLTDVTIEPVPMLNDRTLCVVESSNLQEGRTFLTGLEHPSEYRDDDDELFTRVDEDESITLPMKWSVEEQGNAMRTKPADGMEDVGGVQEIVQEVKSEIAQVAVEGTMVNQKEREVDEGAGDVSVSEGAPLPTEWDDLVFPKEELFIPSMEESLPSPAKKTIHKRRITRKDLIEQLRKRYRSVHSLTIKIIEEDPVSSQLGEIADGSLSEEILLLPKNESEDDVQISTDVEEKQLAEADDDLDSLFENMMGEDLPPPQTQGIDVELESVDIIQQEQSVDNVKNDINTLSKDTKEIFALRLPSRGFVNDKTEALECLQHAVSARSDQIWCENESGLFLPMQEGEKVGSPRKEMLVLESRCKKVEAAMGALDDNLEAARAFQRKMLAGDDEDVILIEKPVTQKENMPGKTKAIKHRMSEQVGRKPVIKRADQTTRSRKGSGSSIEFAGSYKIKKPTLDQPNTQIEQSQRKRARRVRFEDKANTDNGSDRYIVEIATTPRTISQQVADPRLNGIRKVKNENTIETFNNGKCTTNSIEARQIELNFQVRDDPRQSEAYDASNSKSTANPTTQLSTNVTQEQPISQTPQPKSKPLYWKDVKEKPPSTKYGHDVNRPLGADDGSMDAFIVTESKTDSKPMSKTASVTVSDSASKPATKTARFHNIADVVSLHPDRPSGSERQGHRGLDRVKREYRRRQETRQTQERYLQERRTQSDAQEKQQQYSEIRTAPTAPIYDTNAISPRKGGSESARTARIPSEYHNTDMSSNNDFESLAQPAVRGKQAKPTKPCEQTPKPDGKPNAPHPSSSGEKIVKVDDIHDLSVGHEMTTSSHPGIKDDANKTGPTHKTTTKSRYQIPKPKLTAEFTHVSPAKAAPPSSLCIKPPGVDMRSYRQASPYKGERENVERAPSRPDMVLDEQKRTPSDTQVEEPSDPMIFMELKRTERSKRARVDVELAQHCEFEQILSSSKYGMNDEGEERKAKKLKGKGSCDKEGQGRKVGYRVEMPVSCDLGQASGLTDEVMEVSESQEPTRVWVSGKEGSSMEESDQTQLSDKGKGGMSDIEEPVTTISRPSTGGKSIPDLEKVPFEGSSREPSPTLTPPPVIHTRTSRKTIPKSRRALTASIKSAVQVSSPDIDSDDSDRYHTDDTATVSADASRRHSNLDFSLIPGEPLYRYTVTRNDLVAGVLADEEPLTTYIGSFYSLKEANLQAEVEAFRAPLQERTARKRKRGRNGAKEGDGLEGERVPGNEINVVTDEFECRSWRIIDTVGRGVAIAVVRDVAPRREHVPLLLEGAVRLPRKIYVVNQLLKAGNIMINTGDGEDDNEGIIADREVDIDVSTLEVNNVLELANKRAGRAVHEFKTRHLGKTYYDIIERYDREKEMSERQAKLERNKELFDEIVDLKDGGVVKVWVAMLEVKGPRN